jgi:hypothetical protein
MRILSGNAAEHFEFNAILTLKNMRMRRHPVDAFFQVAPLIT